MHVRGARPGLGGVPTGRRWSLRCDRSPEAVTRAINAPMLGTGHVDGKGSTGRGHPVCHRAETPARSEVTGRPTSRGRRQGLASPPMINRIRIILLIAALAVIGAACSSDDSADEVDAGPTETAPAETDEATTDDDGGEAAAPAADLSVTAVSFSTNTVTVRNDGDSEVNLDGWFLCNRPTYIGAPSETIAPGATLDIDVSDLGLGTDFGEFGLYTSSDFGSADAIAAYVQWGQGENGRASVAVEAGLIAEGEFVDNGGEDFTVG